MFGFLQITDMPSLRPLYIPATKRFSLSCLFYFHIILLRRSAKLRKMVMGCTLCDALIRLQRMEKTAKTENQKREKVNETK